VDRGSPAARQAEERALRATVVEVLARRPNWATRLAADVREVWGDVSDRTIYRHLQHLVARGRAVFETCHGVRVYARAWFQVRRGLVKPTRPGFARPLAEEVAAMLAQRTKRGRDIGKRRYPGFRQAVTHQWGWRQRQIQPAAHAA